jgi:hypothetical protein
MVPIPIINQVIKHILLNCSIITVVEVEITLIMAEIQMLTILGATLTLSKLMVESDK